MLIREKTAVEGAFLFRWRSYLPLLLLVPGIIAFKESAQMLETNGGEGFQEIATISGLIISFLGLFIRWMTIGFAASGTSGRNTKQQRADNLNTQDMYSIVRNPLYLGNFLTILGVLIATKVWWLVVIGAMAYWLYIERIIATEEAYLETKFGKSYTDWCQKTPIFIPRLKQWHRSERDFSFKTVLRRESNGVMGVCTAFFAYEFIIDVLFEKESVNTWISEDWQWSMGMLLGTLAFMGLRYIKKNTELLRVKA